MIIRINELKLRPDHTKRELEQEIRRTLRLKDAVLIEKNPLIEKTEQTNAASAKNGKDARNVIRYEIMRQSIDARKKPELYFVYTVDAEAANPKAVMKQVKSKKVQLIEKKEYAFPYALGKKTQTASSNIHSNTRNMSADETQGTSGNSSRLRPVIVGSGPAGLFCALMLARSGCRPIILERGESVDERTKTVSAFWESGQLNPQSNVQFGEGGAGTFSDGKLNTLIKDPEGIIRFVLKEFIKAGADPQILYHHKPHIGTDVLVKVVKNIRTEIEQLGGEVRFNTCLTGIECLNSANSSRNPASDYDNASESTHTEKTAPGTDTLYRLTVNNSSDTILTDRLVLAIGHSARDTFFMLHDFGLTMQPKAFAMGLRIEHKQDLINEEMYGKDCPYELGAAPYKVTHKCEDGRGVYSFCMCPGGYVVNASSEEGMLAVNGMSYSDRGSANANSAIVVTVSPEDYQADGPLSGIAFQRNMERAAYECGGGKIPVQRFEDFCENKISDHFGAVHPQQKGMQQLSNLRTILPEHLNASLIEGIHAFGRRIRGFDDPDVLLSGVESRTSSPVRILRDDSYQAAYRGIFPCGEGAGYAGGITSAAVDGVRVAEAVLKY